MSKLTYPLLVSIQVTDDCNCNCCYCYNLNRTNRYISRSDFDIILKSLVRGKVFHVVLEGGEPLLHNDILYFCNSLYEATLDYTLITNATLVTSDFAGELAKLRPNVIVSLDTLDKEIHNVSRENIDRALQGIETLLDTGVPVGINTVISRYNIDIATNIIDRFYPRIKRFSFLRLIRRTAQDKKIDDLLSFSKQQFTNLGQMLGDFKEKYPDIKIVSPFNFPNDKSATFQEKLVATGCLAGTTRITVKPNLDIIPCSYAQNVVAGNLKESEFIDIWSSTNLEEIRNSTLLPCFINQNFDCCSDQFAYREHSTHPESLD